MPLSDPASEQNWIVCQIGAREHYALASELERRGRLLMLCTDIWSRSGLWPLAARLAGNKKDRILGRFDPALEKARVVSQTPVQLAAPQIARIATGRLQDKWSKIMAANRSFGLWAARQLEQSGALAPQNCGPPVVFAYSYAAKQIFEMAKKAGCTTVLGQIDPGPLEDSLVREVARRHGLSVDDTAYPPQDYWQLWQEECNLADVIVANSAWSAELLARAGIKRSKIKVVPLAYDAPAEPNEAAARKYPPRFTRERPLVCLFLGQANVRKGVVELLQAMERLSDAPVLLKLVGSADPEIRERFKQMPSVDWVGPVSRGATIQFYRGADIFVLPTHSDGFAITQLEALANGLPVIASPHCGEVVHHNVHGLILEAVSPNKIANALRWGIDHPDRLMEMAAQAPARLADFIPGHIIDCFISVAGAS